MKRNVLLIFAFLLCSFSAIMAQNRTVRGKVTSVDDGTRIPGVTVKIKGSLLVPKRIPTGIMNLILVPIPF
jgi:hypothetical protein